MRLSRTYGIVFLHHIHTVADACGVAVFNRFADVEAQPLGRHQAGRQFTRMQRDLHLGVDAVQIVQQAHVQREVAHGHQGVFWHDQVQADHLRICTAPVSQLEPGEHLGKTRSPWGRPRSTWYR